MRKKIVIIIFLMMIITLGVILPNIHPLSNVVKGNKELVFSTEQLGLQHWKPNGEHELVSENDPIITVENLKEYVHDVRLYLNIKSKDLMSQGPLKIQVFYTTNEAEEYSEQRSLWIEPLHKNGYYLISLNSSYHNLRFDLFEQSNVKIDLEKIVVNSHGWDFSLYQFYPFVIIFTVLYMIFSSRSSVLDLIANKKTVGALAFNDIKSRYAGSLLGVLWAFIQPVITIFVFWFVFQRGFRNPPVENVSFILWFIPAYIPWIFFNDAVTSSSNSLTEYSYLVKKVKFNVSVLPLIRVLSASIIHLFFIGFIWLIFVLNSSYPTFYWLQCLYYSFALFCLLVGLSWIVSSLSVFLKDFSQFVNVALQIGFWMTPIFWVTNNMTPGVLMALKLNPLYYIMEGYRDCFIAGTGFWEKGTLTIYYWIVVGMIFIIGSLLFKKLRPHFADML